ncbi:hypothetical protein VTL71DRAFT_2307 [Oculimacula yallundae]|uniref:Uncharacterized protein n=1 Tax=Oculimacula yallundae TaxID=86028 RepID=A0ABR4C8I0_9HELO
MNRVILELESTPCLAESTRLKPRHEFIYFVKKRTGRKHLGLDITTLTRYPLSVFPGNKIPSNEPAVTSRKQSLGTSEDCLSVCSRFNGIEWRVENEMCNKRPGTGEMIGLVFRHVRGGRIGGSWWWEGGRHESWGWEVKTPVFGGWCLVARSLARLTARLLHYRDTVNVRP